MSTKEPTDTRLQEVNVVTPSHRKDKVSAKIVSKGILFQERIGTNYAVAYFKHFGIGFEVALRVLSQPSARRKV